MKPWETTGTNRNFPQEPRNLGTQMMMMMMEMALMLLKLMLAMIMVAMMMMMLMIMIVSQDRSHFGSRFGSSIKVVCC